MKPPTRHWRKALNVIRTCRRLERLSSTLSTRVLPLGSTASHVVINVHDEKDSAADDVTMIKCLVKDKHEDRFRRLGRGAGIAARLASHAESGICGDAGDVRCRKEAFGGNTYPKPKTKSFFAHFRDALSDVFLVALLVCAAVSLGFGIKEHGLKHGWYDAATTFLAVFLVSGVSAAANHRQAKRDDKLASDSADIAVTVVRAARRQDVSIFDVVVGDVVILKMGDAVPADGVFLYGHGLLVDESSLTDDPHPIEIDVDENPFLATGTKVVAGHGSILVTAVGTDTSWGELMSIHGSLNTVSAPLQGRLESLTSTVSNIGVVISVVAFTVLAARHYTADSTENPQMLEKGIPLAVTLMVTFSMKRMLKDNALVHSLSALETMGFVTAICTDNSGMLTLNQMKVTDFWVGTDQPIDATVIAGSVVSLLCQGVGLNTTGSVYKPDNASPTEINGSPTEKALLSWAVAYLAMDTATLKRSCKVVSVEAFNSDKKPSRAITRDNATGVMVAHWKGDGEVVLAKCSMYVDIDAAARELGVEQRNKLQKVTSDMAAGGLRCVAFAYKEVTGTEQSNVNDEGLTLLDLVGMKDRCRPDVKAAIEACTKAGIAVKMVTGDNIPTARSIAMECGIVSSNDPDGVVIEGHEFRVMPTARQLEMVDKIRVMARSRPLDKLVLLKRLKQKGHVVAVTGDDTNDAAALKEADVVLSMSIHGTDVAVKDTLILNDRFDTVVAATRWGRCAYNNFQKIIQFYLTVNVVAMVLNFLPAITTGNVPLTSLQLLWVNLVMGAMNALALAADTPSDAFMYRPPIDRTAPLISNAMWRNLAVQAAFQTAVLLALQYHDTDGDKPTGTMVFNVYVLCQVFNVRDIEKRNVFAGVLKKRMFLVIVALTFLLQVVTVEVLTRFVGSKKLGLGQWGTCFAVAAMACPIGWAVKFIPVPGLAA